MAIGKLFRLIDFTIRRTGLPPPAKASGIDFPIIYILPFADKLDARKRSFLIFIVVVEIVTTQLRDELR